VRFSGCTSVTSCLNFKASIKYDVVCKASEIRHPDSNPFSREFRSLPPSKCTPSHPPACNSIPSFFLQPHAQEHPPRQKWPSRTLTQLLKQQVVQRENAKMLLKDVKQRRLMIQFRRGHIAGGSGMFDCGLPASNQGGFVPSPSLRQLAGYRNTRSTVPRYST
jgi:hypothetical protein